MSGPASDALAGVPTGFGTREAWQEALRAAVRVAQAVRAAGHPCGALQEGREATLTAHELASAIVEATRYLTPVDAVELLVEAHCAKLQVLPHAQALRGRALLRDLRDLETVERKPEAGELESPADRAWRLYTCYERLLITAVEGDVQRELVEYLPLPVVDDLADAGRLTPKAVPARGPRRLYLQARLAPSTVDTDGLQALGWQTELTRRSFYTRLADGDVSVLEQTAGLTDEQSALVAELQAVRLSGRIAPELSRSPWLWPILEYLAPQAPVNVRRDKSFGPWLLVRRIQRALRLAHQSRLRGEEQKRLTMLRSAWNDAHALQDSWTAAGWEARNAIAYLLVLQGEDGPRFEDALEALSPAAGSGMREDRLPWEARRRLETNRDVLHQLSRQRDRTSILNPYLVLGVPDGADNWKDRWRILRSSLDMDGEALANEAKDAIEAFERGRASIPPYAVPLISDAWSKPSVSVPEATRTAMPMPRQTAPAADGERQFARRQAAAAIVRAACENVGLPPVGESLEMTSERAAASE
ncbi:hypothetical protein [Streptomyces sp. NPDC017435]|uniref:hypothetical protein n=1 Tax=Streptomyces sp. NPDC017435 TaxID=3364995 RepID=UPI0037B1ECE3